MLHSSRIAQLMFVISLAMTLPGTAATLSKVPLNLGDVNKDLLYTPMNPCRVADTRLVNGFITGGSTRNFKVVGTASLAFQGGTSGGCGVPVGAAAVEVNVVAVSPDALGNLRGTAYPDPVPVNGAIINYQALNPVLNVANAIILPVCNPALHVCDFDITLFANGGGTHVIIDVVGYFKRFPTEQTITSIGAGNGMSGGGSSGTVILGIADGGVGAQQLAPAAVTPGKINSAGATVGQTLVFNGTAVAWRTGAPGTITGVTAGAGLIGGGTSGNVSLSVAFAGNGSATTVAHSDHRLYANIIIVSPGATPAASGDALVSAVNSIGGLPSATNRYLVKIEPGIYQLTTGTDFAPPPFVDLEGSGEDVTTIKRVDSPSAVTIASDSEWRFLTIQTTSTIGNVTGVFVPSTTTSCRLSNVTVNATGVFATGVFVSSPASAVLKDVTLSCTGTTAAIGILTLGSSTTLSGATISATVSTSSVAAAIEVFAGTTVLADHVNIQVSGQGESDGVLSNGDVTITNSLFNVVGLTAYGIQNVNGNLTCRNDAVTATSTLGYAEAVHNVQNQSATSHTVTLQSSSFVALTNAGFAIYDEGTAGLMSVRVDGCVLVGNLYTVTNLSPSFTPTRITSSRMEGGSALNAVCTFVYDENYTGFPNSCP